MAIQSSRRVTARIAIASALFVAFALGAWMGPGLGKLRDEFGRGRENVRCLPGSKLCVGRELAKTSSGSALVLESVSCEGGAYVRVLDAIQSGACRDRVRTLSFSKGGRWYIVFVLDGRITRIEDGPQMGWAL